MGMLSLFLLLIYKVNYLSNIRYKYNNFQYLSYLKIKLFILSNNNFMKFKYITFNLNILLLMNYLNLFYTPKNLTFIISKLYKKTINSKFDNILNSFLIRINCTTKLYLLNILYSKLYNKSIKILTTKIWITILKKIYLS